MHRRAPFDDVARPRHAVFRLACATLAAVACMRRSASTPAGPAAAHARRRACPEHAGHAQTLQAQRIVELVMRVRQDDLRRAGLHGLEPGADAARMHHYRRIREDLLEGGIVDAAGPFRQVARAGATMRRGRS